jgi:hypothetical protein
MLNVRALLAKDMVGKIHHNGTITNWETINGKVVVTSKCNNCGQEKRNIALQNAQMAIANPTLPSLNCPYCIRPEATAAPLSTTLTDADIDAMSADQYRDYLLKKDQAEKSGKQPIAVLYARFLKVIQIKTGAKTADPSEPLIRYYPDFYTIEEFKLHTPEDQAILKTLTDGILEEAGQASYGL